MVRVDKLEIDIGETRERPNSVRQRISEQDYVQR